MRAVVVEEYSEQPDFHVLEVEEPTPSEDVVTVRVRGAGCNYSDLLMASGSYQVKPPLPFIPGSEIAGEVFDPGTGETRLAAGQRVFGFSGLNAFAELAPGPISYLYPIPEAMSFAEAAVLPIAYGTAYAGLHLRARLEANETVVVHGAAGGTGRAAVELAKAAGARVLAVTSNSEKARVALEAGADAVLEADDDDLIQRVREATGGGADVVFDPVGDHHTLDALRYLAWGGRIVSLGFVGGSIPEVPTNRLLLKNASLLGLNLAGYGFQEPAVFPRIFESLIKLWTEGSIRPLVHKTFPLDGAREALLLLQSRSVMGKLAITP